MSRPLMILLLTTGALMITTEAQQKYDTLPQFCRESINLAIQHANKNSQKHMNYYGVLDYKEEPSGFPYLKVILRETDCEKANEHQSDCIIKTGTPHINCVVCSKRVHDKLQDVFIDCARHKEVDAKKKAHRDENCPRTPKLIGTHSLAAHKSESPVTQTTCLGCF